METANAGRDNICRISETSCSSLSLSGCSSSSSRLSGSADIAAASNAKSTILALTRGFDVLRELDSECMSCQVSSSVPKTSARGSATVLEEGRAVIAPSSPSSSSGSTSLPSGCPPIGDSESRWYPASVSNSSVLCISPSSISDSISLIDPAICVVKRKLGVLDCSNLSTSSKSNGNFLVAPSTTPSSGALALPEERESIRLALLVPNRLSARLAWLAFLFLTQGSYHPAFRRSISNSTLARIGTKEVEFKPGKGSVLLEGSTEEADSGVSISD